MTPNDARDTFDLIPKVELHCHVEGTVRLATVAELARKAGQPLPVDNPELLYRYDSLDSFLGVFWLIQELLASRDDWARVAYESLLDAAGHGLRYRETFFTPARHLADGQDLGEIVERGRGFHRTWRMSAVTSPTSLEWFSTATPRNAGSTSGRSACHLNLRCGCSR